MVFGRGKGHAQFGWFRDSEIGPVLRLALPVILSNGLQSLLQVVDAAFLGHLGPTELAASALGNAYFNMVWFFMLGVSTALDTLAAQANGAGDVVSLRRWGACAAIVLSALCVPGIALLCWSEPVVRYIFGQPPAMAGMTWQYCASLALGLPGLALFTVVQKYQQSQGRVSPSIYVLLAANVLNIGTNYVFVWALGWGFRGSPLGTSLVRTVGCVCLAGWEVVQDPKRRKGGAGGGGGGAGSGVGVWAGSGRGGCGGEGDGTYGKRGSDASPGGGNGCWAGGAALTPPAATCPPTVCPRRPFPDRLLPERLFPGRLLTDRLFQEHLFSERLLPNWLGPSLVSFCALGLPGGLMLGVEAWAFDLQTILAGRMSKVALDANVIVLSICSLAFTTFPFGISTAASIRVGNLLGAQQPRRARATAVACLAVGVGFMALCGLAILTGRDRVAEIFTPDADIRETVAAVAPVVALFQVVDGYQGVAAGVLRGLGRQPTIALINIFAFWVLGIPLGAYLAFEAHMGVEALWIGISVGLTAGSLCFATLLRRVDWSHEARRALLRSTRVGAGGGAAAQSLMQPLRQGEQGWSADGERQ